MTRTKRILEWLRWDGVLSLVLLVLIVGAALFAPWVTPYAPNDASLPARFARPGVSGHILGADHLGRDLLTRIVYGARTSLLVGSAAVILASIIGVTLGLLAGFKRRQYDAIIMAFIEIQMAIPFLILAIAISVVLPPNPINIVILLSISGWVIYARTVRGEVMALSEQEFIQAARATGLTDLQIMRRHVLPNVLPVILIISTLQLPRMIIFEAALSYLGLGLPPPTASWGAMVAAGQAYLLTAWWVSLFPGAGIFITVFAINLLGDWLRDQFDPRYQKG